MLFVRTVRKAAPLAIAIGLAAGVVAAGIAIGHTAPIDELDAKATEAGPQQTDANPFDRQRNPTIIDALLPGGKREAPAVLDDTDKPWQNFSGLPEAEKAVAAGQYREALQELRNAAAANPYLPPHQVIFAGLLMSHGQVALGKRVLEDVAIQQPDHPAVYIMFGNVALFEGRLTDAMVHFEKARQMKLPESWPREIQQMRDRTVLFGLTSVAEQRRDWHKAEGYLRQMVQEDVSNAQLRDRWAVALFHAGREKLAYEQFDIAFRQDETLSRPELSLAALHMHQGTRDQALAWYKQALTEHPDDAKTHAEVASAFFMLDKADIAQQHVDKAAELGLDSLALNMLQGMIARQLGNFDGAARSFASALRKSPDNLEARCQFLLSVVEQSDETKQQKALQAADKLAEDHPRSLRVQATRGWIYARLGQTQMAEELLRPTVSHNAGHPEAIFYLARVLSQRGKVEEARQLAEALQHHIDAPGIFVPRLEARRFLANILTDG